MDHDTVTRLDVHTSGPYHRTLGPSEDVYACKYEPVLLTITGEVEMTKYLDSSSGYSEERGHLSLSTVLSTN